MERHFGHYIRMLHCRMDQTINNALAQLELTAAQGRLMGYLAHQKEPKSPKDIEEAFSLSHPTVSGLLARMEKKGFIECRPDPKDKRSKRVYILPKGWECHAQIHQTIMDHEEQMARGFSEEEKAQFYAFLGRALSNVGADCCVKNKEETQL